MLSRQPRPGPERRSGTRYLTRLCPPSCQLGWAFDKQCCLFHSVIYLLRSLLLERLPCSGNKQQAHFETQYHTKFRMMMERTTLPVPTTKLLRAHHQLTLFDSQAMPQYRFSMRASYYYLKFAVVSAFTALSDKNRCSRYNFIMAQISIFLHRFSPENHSRGLL